MFVSSLNHLKWQSKDKTWSSIHSSFILDSCVQAKSGQTKDYKIGVCCFFDKHAFFRRKSKDWLAWNEDNVSEWSDMSTHRLLFQ